jgi:hypothetical protein
MGLPINNGDKCSGGYGIVTTARANDNDFTVTLASTISATTDSPLAITAIYVLPTTKLAVAVAGAATAVQEVFCQKESALA